MSQEQRGCLSGRVHPDPHAEAAALILELFQTSITVALNPPVVPVYNSHDGALCQRWYEPMGFTYGLPKTEYNRD